MSVIYRRRQPSPPLAALVDCLWYSEGFDGSHQRERLLPNGESGIVFDLREAPVRIYNTQNPSQFQTFAPAIFCGARLDSFVIDTCDQERVIGIQFRPGGAAPFLSMPASEVANSTFALEDIWPGHALLIREQLLSAAGIEAMFAILERALLARLVSPPSLHPAVRFAIAQLTGDGVSANSRSQDQSQPVRIIDVAECAGLSPRRLNDLFQQQTGLTPKAFHRVRRFQRMLQTLRASAEPDWADLAAGCGYYDQAHFIHEFRIFAGMTPSEYTRLATPHLNHVPLA